MTQHRLGVTRACGLIGISTALYRYECRNPEDAAVRDRLCKLAALKRQYGYRRLLVLLRREGLEINHKRTFRVYQAAGLSVRRRKRKRIGVLHHPPMIVATGPNQRWLRDFVSDGLADGRKLRCLNIVDDYTKECLAIEVDTSLSWRQVAAVMERLLETRGLPESVTVDNGPEFTGKAFDKRAYRHRRTLRFIDPDKPQQNAHIESSNEKFRDECLNEYWFVSLRHAKALIEDWR